VKVEITVTRVYDMDEQRVLSEPSFDPPASDAPLQEKRRWLVDSFYELCGWQRDQDHVDGSYVGLSDEYDSVDFEWPEALQARGRAGGDK
jgi:hypothetical protein